MAIFVPGMAGPECRNKAALAAAERSRCCASDLEGGAVGPWKDGTVLLWLGFLAAAMAAFGGVWAVTHPEPRRPAVHTSFGLEFSPQARQRIGWFVIVGALVFLYVVVPRLA